MKSIAIATNQITLPYVEGEYSMIPFDLSSLEGLGEQFSDLVKKMLQGIKHSRGTAFFTIHGKKLRKGETLRRGGPHTDGSYDQATMSWGGGGGWKIGENGPSTDSKEHKRLYNSETGGIILCSNFEACLGWVGEYDGLPGVGGDCSKIKLDEPFLLERNKVYYGNNHFIHESLPMSDDVHRVFARITLPEDHHYCVDAMAA